MSRLREYVETREYSFLEIAAFLLAAAFFAVYIDLFYESCMRFNGSEITGLLGGIVTPGVIIRIAILLLIAILFLILVAHLPKSYITTIYRYRWPIGVALICILVLFKVSGSSLAAWTLLLPANSNSGSGTLWGIPRMIRSDEFTTGALWTLSQDYNGYNPISNILRGDYTDTRLVYGLPSWSLITIFRPFSWGYLLLGFDRGLAFAWSAKYVILFLTAFDCAMLFLKQNKSISLCFAIFVTFSPVIQWWGTGEIVLYGQSLVLCLEIFLTSTTRFKRLLSSMILAWLCGCYIMTMYPAWMVPFFYIFALLGISRVLMFISQRKVDLAYLKLSLLDFIVLFIACAVVAILIALSFNASSDVLMATSGTVYPGSRFETGGNSWLGLLNFGAPLFYAIESPHVSNSCEMATMFCLFPLGTICALVGMFKRQFSKYLIPLWVLQIIFCLYCFVGFPSFLAKISLMSNVPAVRLLLPMGYLETILLFASISGFFIRDSRDCGRSCLSTSKRRARQCAPILIAFMAFCVAYFACRCIDPTYFRFIYVVLLAFACIAICLAGAAFLQNTKFSSRIVIVVSVLVSLAPGLCVNPVQIGTAPITKTDLKSAVSDVLSKDDSSLWIVEGPWTVANLCAAYGAPTLNSTNAYPDIDRWSLLDPSHDNNTVYNRYAHISVNLGVEETAFVLNQDDWFTVDLSFNDIKRLGVSYLVSTKDYDGVDITGISFDKIGNANGFNIYKLTY